MSVCWDIFLSCNSGWPGIHCVDQANFKLRNPPTSSSGILGLKLCTTISGTPVIYTWTSLSKCAIHFESLTHQIIFFFTLNTYKEVSLGILMILRETWNSRISGNDEVITDSNLSLAIDTTLCVSCYLRVCSVDSWRWGLPSRILSLTKLFWKYNKYNIILLF